MPGRKGLIGVALVFQSEQHGGEVAVGPGQKRMAPRRRFEAGGHGEGAGARIEARPMSAQVAAVTNQIGMDAAPPRVAKAGCMENFLRFSPC